MEAFIRRIIEAFMSLKDKDIVELSAIATLLGFSILGFIHTGYKTLRHSLRWAVHMRSFKRHLYPFFDSNEINKALKYYINTKCQNLSPSNEDEPIETHAIVAKEEILPFFINKVFTTTNFEKKFFIILADSGMGKTTFMLSLYQRYRQKLRKHFNIYLFPLGYHSVDKEIAKIGDDEKEKSLLLLDAFDEDIKASRGDKERLNKILRMIERFRIVIITCRTQFFSNEHEEPYGTGLLKFGTEKGEHTFHKLYISPFDDNDIKKYLSKKYSIFYRDKRKKAFEIVKKAPYLMIRPMLLSNIDDFLNLEYELSQTIDIYEVMVSKWIDREASRIPQARRENYIRDLTKFTEEVAIDIYNNEEKRGGLFIKEDDIQSYAKNSNIDLNAIEIKSRSLLNRDSIGNYKFSHKSIFEYLLAKHCFLSKCSIKKTDTSMELYNVFLQEFHAKEHLFPILSKFSTGEYEIENSTPQYGLIKKSINQLIFDLNNTHRIVSLKIVFTGICNISFLAQFLRLRKVDIICEKLEGHESISKCGFLEYIKIKTSVVFDLSTIKDVNNLKKLSITSPKINNIHRLSSFKNLAHLNLPYFNSDIIEYIFPLTNLTKISFTIIHQNDYKKFLQAQSHIQKNIKKKINIVYPILKKIVSIHPQYEESRNYPKKILQVSLPEYVENDILSFMAISDEITKFYDSILTNESPIDKHSLSKLDEILTRWNNLYDSVNEVAIEFVDTIEQRLNSK